MADVEEWVERLSDDDLLIVRLLWSKRRLSGFVLNYVATIDGEPVVVCRYDTCHGHLHVHHFWRTPPALVDLEDPTRASYGYEHQLDLVQRDLAANWRAYRARLELNA